MGGAIASKIARTVLAAACLTAVSAFGAITLDAPGHVCIEGEGTVAHGGESGAGWTLKDWRGRENGVSGVFGEDGSAALPPLPAGYYEICGESRLATLAVVPRPETRVFDRDSFYGVDSAQTQLTNEPFLCPWNGGDRFRTISDLIALAGIPHVRDRFSAAMIYGDNTNSFALMMRNSELFHDRRIASSGLFYRIPKQIAPLPGRIPTDLAALRDLCARAAADFGPCLGDFEFLNEVDLSRVMTVWDYAAAMKAASIGFRSASRMPVIPSGLSDANPGGFYFRTLLNNDAAKYVDAFNLHTYLPIPGYRNLVGRTRACLADCGFGGKAVWFTEVGTNMDGHSREDGAIAGFKAHSPEQELVVAEFLPKSLVALQMEGVARAYFFVFHPYSERDGKKDWGIMRRDGTVKPAYAAFSAMTKELVSAVIAGEIDVGAGARAFLFEQPDGSQTVAFWSASEIDAGDGEGIAPTPDLAREVKLSATSGAYRLTDMCGRVSSIAAENGILSLPATRFPAYVSGLRGLSPDKPAKARGSSTPYLPTPDEDLSIIVRAELDERDFTISRGQTRASLNSGTGRLRVIAWNLGSAAKTGMVEVAGGRVAGLPQEPFRLGPSESATFDCVYSPDDGGDFDRNLVLFGRFDGKRGSRLSIPIWLDDRFLASCMTVPLAWNNPARWSRNDSAQKYDMTWDAKEGAIRFDVEWTGENVRWFYPFYHLADGETLEGARMLSFEVRSDQDKVENDHGRAYVMLGGNLGYGPPNGNWEKRYVELPADGIAHRRNFRVGVNPRGHRLTFWIRNVSILKPR